MNKCIGCGVILQSNQKKKGYTSNLENNLCERCFKIRNYNDYQIVIKDNNDYINILNKINETDDLVVLVIDLLNINDNLSQLNKYINNKILLVLTKFDLIPSNNEEKFINFFNDYNFNIVDTVIISSYKNYHFDLLYEKIHQYKTSNRVYIVGYTNAGKSTMINKLIYNYSDKLQEITTSSLPSTTLDTIEIELDDLIIVDTPGLLDNSIVNYVDSSLLKTIIPKKKIKPITYQIKGEQIILIDDIFRIDCKNTNITFYFSNSLNIKRYYKDIENMKEYKKHHLKVDNGNDIVIAGLGFIKVSKSSEFDIYVIGDTNVFVRSSLIGG